MCRNHAEVSNSDTNALWTLLAAQAKQNKVAHGEAKAKKQNKKKLLS